MVNGEVIACVGNTPNCYNYDWNGQVLLLYNVIHWSILCLTQQSFQHWQLHSTLDRLHTDSDSVAFPWKHYSSVELDPLRYYLDLHRGYGIWIGPGETYVSSVDETLLDDVSEVLSPGIY